MASPKLPSEARDHPVEPSDHVAFAALLASSYRNGVPKGLPARGGLIALRGLTAGAVRGVLEAATAPDSGWSADPTLLVVSFQNANNQLVSLRALQDAAYKLSSRDDGVGHSQEVGALAEVLRSHCTASKFDPDVARDMLRQFEGAADRFAAFQTRTAVAAELLRLAGEGLGIEWLQVGAGQLRRSLVFPPESKQAAIGVLSYFSHVLKRKYPTSDVGVTIEQKGDRVTLIIDTPEGQREIIDRELHEYALVVTGKVDPDVYMDDPVEALALKQKLELAALEVRHTRELLSSERAQYGDRIGSLEQQVGFLQRLLDGDQYGVTVLVEALRDVAATAAPLARAILEPVISKLEEGAIEPGDDIVTRELRVAIEADRTIFDKLNDLILRGAVQGAAGNYLYSWLQALAAAMKW